MYFDDVIRERRSVRHFTERAVEVEKIEAIIRCAALSPSAKNRQPWFFSVLEGEGKNDFGRLLLERAREINIPMVAQTAGIILDAAVLILVFSGADNPNPSFTDILSVGGAMYGMCLKATDLGLGSLWIGDTDVLADDLAAQVGQGILYGAVALGYPARHYPPRPRKPFERITDLGNPTVAERIHDDIEILDLAGASYAFCSYSHANSDTVRADMVELQRHNIPIWYDKELTVGEAWDDNALAMLRAPDCRAMLLYISPESISSPAVARELAAALDRRATDPEFVIIPIHIGARPLSKMLAEVGDAERTDLYTRAFGEGDRVIYIPRDLYPSSLRHVERVIDSLCEIGVVADGRVYDGFAYEIKNGEYAVITRYLGFSEVVTPPSAISGYPVRVIGDGAFAGSDTLIECVIPDTVHTLGAGVFRACSRLISVSLPWRMSELGVACFRDATALASICLPEGLTVLREALFRGCHSLAEITVPDGVTEMEEAVFRHCHALRRATLPPSLRRMTEGGFYDCPSLVELTIPEDVEGLEIQSFDTSPHLKRTVAGGFIFDHGTAVPVPPKGD